MDPLEQSIERLEKLYERVAGRPLDKGQIRHTISEDNMDPCLLIDQRLQMLIATLQDPTVARALQPWTPPASMWENDERIFLRLDLAGVRKEDLDLNVEGNVLIVCGVRRSLMGEQHENLHPCRLELMTGPFVRYITLPSAVSIQEINSNLENGILEITIPKNFVAASAGGPTMSQRPMATKKGKGDVQ